jgi:hypothetical protein
MQQILEMFLSAYKINLKSGGEEKLKTVRMDLLLQCEFVAYDIEFRENLLCEGNMEGMVHCHW